MNADDTRDQIRRMADWLDIGAHIIYDDRGDVVLVDEMLKVAAEGRTFADVHPGASAKWARTAIDEARARAIAAANPDPMDIPF